MATDNVPVNGQGPGGTYVGTVGIIVSLTIVFVFSIMLLYTMMKLWPHTTPSFQPDTAATTAASSTGATAAAATGATPGTAAATTGMVRGPGGTVGAPAVATQARGAATEGAPALSDRNGYLYCAPQDTTSRWIPIPLRDTLRGADCIVWLGRPMPIWIEQRLFLIVVLAGALGATVHALRSLAWYIGNRQLVWSWLAFYLSLPLVGSLLAGAFYLIVRGGFFNPQQGVQATSPFGFAALGVLIGMFTTPAVLKLKEIAETILTKPSPGADAAPQQTSTGTTTAPAVASGPPAITGATRQKRAAGAATDALILTGTGFTATSTAQVNDVARPIEFKSAEQIVLPLTDDDLKRIEAGGDFVIVITNPNGAASKPYDFAD